MIAHARHAVLPVKSGHTIMNFDFSQLTPADAFKLLSSVVVPRPIACGRQPIARRTAERRAVFLFQCGQRRPAHRGAGHRAARRALKDTSRNILATGEFVINVASAGLAEQMNRTSLDYIADVNELTRAGLSTEPSLLGSAAAHCAKPRRAGVPRLASAGSRAAARYRIGARRRDVSVRRGHPEPPALPCGHPGAAADLGRMHGAGWYTHTDNPVPDADARCRGRSGGAAGTGALSAAGHPWFSWRNE